MNKLLKILLAGSHLICVKCSNMEKAQEIKDDLTNQIEGRFKENKAAFMGCSSYSFRSDMVIGFEIVDCEPTMSEKIIDNQNKVIEILKGQMGEGEEWRRGEEE